MKYKTASKLANIGTLICMVVGGSMIGDYSRKYDTDILWLFVPFLLGTALAYLTGINDKEC